MLGGYYFIGKCGSKVSLKQISTGRVEEYVLKNKSLC